MSSTDKITYIVAGRGPRISRSASITGTEAAIRKGHEFRADGLDTIIIFDMQGREWSIDQLEASTVAASYELETPLERPAASSP